MREAWPELSDYQARILLVSSCRKFQEADPEASIAQIEKLIDKRTRYLCKTSIVEIGDLLNQLPTQEVPH